MLETFNRTIVEERETETRVETIKKVGRPQTPPLSQGKMIRGIEVDIPNYTRYWVLPLLSVIIAAGLFFLYITLLQPSFLEFDGIRKGFGSSISAFIPFLRY